MKIYVSHSIRGKYGNNATNEQMKANCAKAMQFAKLLRLNCTGIEYYVPAEHDEWITLAFQQGIITDTQILSIDCDILDTRDGLLVYTPDGYISGGMTTEIVYAKEFGIPTYYTNGHNWAGIHGFFENLAGESHV